MPHKIAITTSSFAQDDSKPVQILEGKNCILVRNSFGRSLSKEETLDLLKGCQGVVAGLEVYDAAVLDQLKELKVISRVGVGLDNVDVAYCQKKGITVLTTPDGPIQSVAELTLGMILNLLRHISVMDRTTHQGQWQKKMGSLLAEKKVGVIGLGRIGREVARLCEAFGAKILFYDPFMKADTFPHYQSMDFKTLLQDADIITLHLPLTEKSRALIGEKEFSMMKKNAILINCSRGEMVDEAALHHALKNKVIQGAALDVFHKEPYTGPLQELDNIILTPHVGSYAKEIRVKMELEAVQNLIQALKI